MADYSFFDRDFSWLTFNYRVLEEAARTDTPLLERVFFLSVYSSNLDEFHRVRVPAVAALQKIKETRETYTSTSGIQLLTKISSRLNHQLERFGQSFTGQVLPALADRSGRDFCPENDLLYFLIILNQESPAEQAVVLNIPSDSLPRFYTTEVNGQRQFLFIDDIIRDNLGLLFPGATISGAYSSKITRDAEQSAIFLGSSDWMNRNIYRRIEVCFPLYDPRLKAEICQLIRLQLADNVAATPIDAANENPDTAMPATVRPNEAKAVRSQEAIYRYVAEQSAKPADPGPPGP